MRTMFKTIIALAVVGASVSVVPSMAQQSGGMPDLSLPTISGTANLRSRFRPDPRRVSVTAGGELDAGVVGAGCVGSISTAADYEVTYTRRGNRPPPLIFRVRSSGDTTLVINDANGNWQCNDDTNGFDPEVTFEDPASGVYDIWVGSYDGQMHSAQLQVTERRRVQ